MPSFPETPHIRTALPGPRARAIVATDKKYISPSYTRPYPFVMKKGRGAIVEDVDGNFFLDFTAGIAVTTTGHCHPRVVKAIQQQTNQFLHMAGTDFYYEPQSRLAKKLAQIAPGPSQKRVLFSNSGAEAVEAAFKLARYVTKRSRMISFMGAFHGRTLGALSLTGSKTIQLDHFAPLIPNVTHIGYGYCYRCPYNLEYPTCDIACARYPEEILFKKTVPPDEVAAVIVEPIQGEGGYISPPPEFHRILREITKKHGILLIVDEVQTGMGRTGKMFAIEHWGVEPDIMCLSKGLASGMPLGAVVAKADLMTWVPGSHGSTFGGNPVACAAALETIDLLEEGLIDNAYRTGGYLLERLHALQERFPLIGDVRGKGLMVGIELVKGAGKAPAVKEREAVIQRCFRKGLLLLGCGESGIRFSPPLVVTKRQVDIACRILEEAFRSLR
jgi:4-aminobutyrate aminotransferase